MTEIEARRAVDDDAHWLERDPVYRVEFWTQKSFPEPPVFQIWQCDPFQLRGVADVREVFEWAAANAAGRSYVVYAEVSAAPKTGFVHLFGVDPTWR